MPCCWSRRAESANSWTPRAVTLNPWTGRGAIPAAWSPDPFFLMLDDGGFLELRGCGRLVLETAHV